MLQGCCNELAIDCPMPESMIEKRLKKRGRTRESCVRCNAASGSN